ncbi:MAG TPA: Wzz/FepE/Etk N-terminal domain-containing protein [Streptosporangiaceae bacterium]|nr:Wzz/FepE/Etk N-terminal domain-containing protein [Streptosporangiaceae bacterium]
MTPAAPSTANGHTGSRLGAGATGDGFVASRHRQGDIPGGLVSLRSLGQALRRRAWVVCAATVAGLAVSGCLFVFAPPAYQAESSVLITNNPDLDPASQMVANVALAQSLQVAASALRKLGLHESVISFAHSYTVAAPTDEVLEVTANASSLAGAERLANAVAAGFMQYRANLLQVGQQIDVPTLNQQIAVENAKLTKITNEITTVSAEPKTPQRDKKLTGLAKGQQALYGTIGALKYDEANYPLVTLSMIKGTAMLDAAAPVPPTRKHVDLLTAFAGLIAGLTVGLGIVLIEAAASDRPRRRREIARALGAPIKLTIGNVHRTRLLPGRPRLAADRAGDIARLVAHLRSNVRHTDGKAAVLAVVPVGNADVAALGLVRLATSSAREGKRVLLADLAPGAPAGRLLKVSRPGVQFAGTERERVVVAVPEPSDRLPVGPRRSASQAVPRIQPGKALAAVHASADLLLTITTLDPTYGAEHLTTWTTDVVVVVTAGRSAMVNLKATGEMIRLAGLRLVSVVLVGADKADESLGTMPGSSRLARRKLAAGSRQSALA